MPAIVAAAGPVRAADIATVDPRRAVLFASMEAGPGTTFGSAGLKLAVGGPLDASGFRVMAKIGGGMEPLRSAPPREQAATPEALAVAGYEWKLGATYLGLYGGVEADARLKLSTLAVDRQVRAGFRVQADLWSNPTADTLVHISANAGGANPHVWTRGALGWRMFENTFMGPEVEIYREKHYRKDRLGAHLTGLKLFGTEMRVSGGWQRTGDRQAGPYVSLNLHWKR